MLLPLRRFRQAAVSLLLFARLAPSAHAQDTPLPSAVRVDQILAAIDRARPIGQVAVSPDGKRVAFVLDGEIRLAAADNLALNVTSSRRITAATPDQRCAEGNLAWSPDSGLLAFTSDCAQPGEQSDLYLSPLDDNPPTRLSTLQGDIQAPAFSPDGRTIAFLYIEGATRPAGAQAAMKPPSGVIGEQGIEIQRVAQVTIPSPLNCEPPKDTAANRALGSRAFTCLLGPATFLTPADLHVYEFDWSPDSQSLAYIAADPPGENNWWIAKLYTQREEPKIVLSPAEISGPLHGLQIALPRWSPDGKSIAFIGGLMSDQGLTGGDVWIVPATGGQPTDLMPNRPASATWIAWENNVFIYAAELAGGNSQLVDILVPSAGPSSFVSAPLFSVPATTGAGGSEFSLSTTTDRSLFAFAASSFDRPPEIYAMRAPNSKAMAGRQTTNPIVATGFSALTQLSHFNDAAKPAWGNAVSLNWTNDNLHIQGWLIPPAHYDPARKYPLIVEVHGGPSAAALPRWGEVFPFSPAVFSALGYFVLLPNPRGSFGQGEAFTQANRRDFGYGDLRDILAGVDAVLARYSVDPDRIGLDGWSYGGFMAMFALTKTHRFRAAVAGAGISDWLSYYGENSIGQWMIPFFGASVYDDPAAYARSSAIDFIKNVSTPTLLLVGDRDGECPAPQSFEFWHALRDRHVSTRLVVYPNEGHGIADPAHRLDVLARSVDWFARYLPPAPQ